MVRSGVEIQVKLVHLILGNESKGQRPDVWQIGGGNIGLESLHSHLGLGDVQSESNAFG